MHNYKTNKRNVKLFFKFGCIAIVTFMIGYWLYKFDIEDRDIGVVDFVSIEEVEIYNRNLPVASL